VEFKNERIDPLERITFFNPSKRSLKSLPGYYFLDSYSKEKKMTLEITSMCIQPHSKNSGTYDIAIGSTSSLICLAFGDEKK
jgi:hypothetical protein